MDIRMLDIDQCPGKYHMPNAFKDTHKCDDKSSYVSTAQQDKKPKRDSQVMIILFNILIIQDMAPYLLF